MINDFWYIFTWWLIICLFGFGALPITFKLFKDFFDKGYIFSKIIGVLLTTFVIWLTVSLHLFTFNKTLIWATIAAMIVGNLYLSKKFDLQDKKQIKNKLKIFILEEIIFFLALAGWSFVRGFQPDIQGLEKFMDFGFVNSILKSQSFPPNDMWLSGYTVNYYYFGHLITAVLTIISGLDPAITYNLAISLIFALAVTASFSLGGNIIYAGAKTGTTRLFLAGGILTALLLNLGGNLHPLYSLIKNRGFESYWYPDATRFIVEKFGAADNTIHEFPIYSYVVADLHGHMIDIPAVILFLALLFRLLLTLNKKGDKLILVGMTVLLAIMYMTSTWDFAIYLMVFALVVLLSQILIYGANDKAPIKSLTIGGPVFIVSLILTLPFNLHFTNIAGGIGLSQYRSPVWMLFVLWGWPLFFTLIYLYYFLFARKQELKMPLKKDGLSFEFAKRLSLGAKKINIVDIFIIGLLAISWLLIFLPEVIYIKDIYIQSYQRANTMFKFTYQSFIMFSFAGSYVLLAIIPKIKIIRLRITVYCLSLILLASLLIYSYFAVKSYYGLKTYKSLYGLGYLRNVNKGDFEAIKWLVSQQGSPTIVEAVGESYTDFARISANTGLPTILGWRVHEWLWRGSFDEAGKRTEEVKQIYESTSEETTKELLTKFKVTYVIIGSMERKQYPNIQEGKFKKLGAQIFSSNGTVIYKIN